MTLNKTDNKELSKWQSKPDGNSNHFNRYRAVIAFHHSIQTYNYNVTLVLQHSRKREHELHEK